MAAALAGAVVAALPVLREPEVWTVETAQLDNMLLGADPHMQWDNNRIFRSFTANQGKHYLDLALE